MEVKPRMRKDIYEHMKILQKEGIKPNYAEIGRRYGCDYRTAKKYYEDTEDGKGLERKKRSSKLDEYKGIIEEKIDLGCKFYSIYLFIQKKGYKGKYTILRDYCKQYKDIQIKKATIRFETNPGLQAQVDWKEDFVMESRKGDKYKINIFLMLLGYSREKYLEATLDRSQDTVKKCIINAIKDFGGVPKEILFDNMKTVIDQSQTEYHKAVVNDKFYQFSKDIGFEVWACRAYRPQTKGKVESLARTCERLMVYNHEFDTFEELEEIVKKFKEELNNEISQGTGQVPNEMMKKEKEYLHSLPNQDILDTYLATPLERKVSKESMIVYNKKKYSLPTNYIGKIVEIKVENGKISIYFEGIHIVTHEISSKTYNYKEQHYQEILRSDAMKNYSMDDIDAFAKKQLRLYDELEA